MGFQYTNRFLLVATKEALPLAFAAFVSYKEFSKKGIYHKQTQAKRSICGASFLTMVKCCLHVQRVPSRNAPLKRLDKKEQVCCHFLTYA